MKKNLLLAFTLLACMQFATAQTVQKVVIEEFTGAWCGYCPDGARILDDILTTQSNAIGVYFFYFYGQTYTSEKIKVFF